MGGDKMGRGGVGRSISYSVSQSSEWLVRLMGLG
jgi:hypothetical protein